jgi:hypothetical protein
MDTIPYTDNTHICVRSNVKFLVHKKIWPVSDLDPDPVPEFIDPVLGFKTVIFMKTSTKCSFSFQSMLRDAGIG